MKNKILIGLLVGIVLIGVAFAFEEGDIFTQQQVDGFDVDTITWQTLECSQDGWHISYRNVYIDYSCLMLEQTPYNETLYEVVNGNFEFGVSIPQALACVIRYDIPTCRDRFRALARQDALQTVEMIKEQIRDYQTTDGDDIGGWFDGWDLFGG